MNNLVIRTISGIFFVIILVGSILLGPYAFISVFALITGFLLVEFYRLMNAHQGVRLDIWSNMIGGVLLFLGAGAFSMGIEGRLCFVPYLAYLLYLFIHELYGKKEEPIRNWAYALLGQIYIALPFSLLNLLAFLEIDGISTYRPLLVLSLFVFIWMNDTGAYIVGSRIGKRRLFERISPKKSWEGFFGGIAFSLLAGYIFSLFVPEMSLIHWLVMAIIVSIFSTWGDLSESLLKRTIGVKDSGSMIPGHGGFLDRFDSVLLACPAVIIYFEIVF